MGQAELPESTVRYWSIHRCTGHRHLPRRAAWEIYSGLSVFKHKLSEMPAEKSQKGYYIKGPGVRYFWFCPRGDLAALGNTRVLWCRD